MDSPLFGHFGGFAIKFAHDGLGMTGAAIGGAHTHRLFPKSSRYFFAIAVNVLPPVALGDAVLRRVLAGCRCERACVLLQPVGNLVLGDYIDHHTAAEVRGHVFHQFLPSNGWQHAGRVGVVADRALLRVRRECWDGCADLGLR